jgi:hypothetical protein
MPQAVGFGLGLSLQVCRAGLTLLAGQPKTWMRNTDSGGRLTCQFCGDCGSRLWHEATQTSETVTLKAGCLDQPPDLTGAIHIWTARKLKGRGYSKCCGTVSR